MRNLTPLPALGMAAALSLVAGCSGSGSYAITPRGVPPQAGSRFLADQHNINTQSTHRNAGHDACPATGPIKYVSNLTNGSVNIYAGKFAGQSPCGQIVDGISNPQGMYVNPATHDLYVAGGVNIQVYHRGETSPFNTYTDPTVQAPRDVTMSRDGTIFASNSIQVAQVEGGSISTWISGRHGGRWIGNFAMANGGEGEYITVQKNDLLYYDDINLSGGGELWTVSCPYGNCGVQTQVTGVSMNFPGGLGSDNAGDLLAIDGQPGALETFKLPNTMPKSFAVAGFPRAMALNPNDHHVFISDGSGAGAAEFLYPSGKLIGTVKGAGSSWGVAVDPGHTP